MAPGHFKVTVGEGWSTDKKRRTKLRTTPKILLPRKDVGKLLWGHDIRYLIMILLGSSSLVES